MVDVWNVLADFDRIWRVLDDDGSEIIDKEEMLVNNREEVFDGLAFGDHIFKVPGLFF